MIVATTGEGMFIYSGVPAAGNLVVAITNQAGTDDYGNAYQQGVSVLDEANNAFIALGPSGLLEPSLIFNPDDTLFDPGRLLPLWDNINGGIPYIQWDSASAAGSAGVASIRMRGESVDLTVAPAFEVNCGSEISGDMVFQPGFHVRRGSLASPTLAAGWTNFAGGFQTSKYIEQPHNWGELTGVIKPGTLTNGTVITTLPAAVRPLASHTFNPATGNGASCQIVVAADGTVKIQAVVGTPTFVSLSGISWPLF